MTSSILNILCDSLSRHDTFGGIMATTKLYKIMQRDIFSFLIFVNPTRVIQATIPG